MNITLTPDTLAALAGVLDCQKSKLLSGSNAYVEQEWTRLALRAVQLLMEANPEVTGLNKMLAEVAAIEADIDGEFAAQREALAIFGDTHAERNKAQIAHLKQTLAAVKLDVQAAQVEEFRA